MPGVLLDQFAEGISDSPKFAVAVRVLQTPQNHLSADHLSALGHGHHGVATGVGAPVVGDQPGDFLAVERDLRDQHAVGRGQVAGHQRRLAAVPSEQLNDRDALVRSGDGAQAVDEFDAARDRCGESDAVVRPVDVVIHRLRDGDNGHALVVEPKRIR